MRNNKFYSSFEYIKIITYFRVPVLFFRCGIFLHHCELSQIFYREFHHRVDKRKNFPISIPALLYVN